MRRANNDAFLPNSKELCMDPNKRPDECRGNPRVNKTIGRPNSQKLHAL